MGNFGRFQSPTSNVNVQIRGLPPYRTQTSPLRLRPTLPQLPQGTQNNRRNATLRFGQTSIRKRQHLGNSTVPRRLSSHRSVQIFPIRSAPNATVSLPVRLSPLRSSGQRRQIPATARRGSQLPRGRGTPVRSALRRIIPGAQNHRNQAFSHISGPRSQLLRLRGNNNIRRSRTNNVANPRSRNQLPRRSSLRNRVRNQDIPIANTRRAQAILSIPRDQSRRLSTILQRVPNNRANQTNEQPVNISTAQETVLPSQIVDNQPNMSANPIETTPHNVINNYNGTDMVIELNRTLSKYGLDVDGLIALLQNSRHHVTGSPSPNRVTSRDILEPNVTPNTLPPFSPQGQTNNATGLDNPFQTLTDVRNELRDIALLLQGGLSTNINQTESTTMGFLRQTQPSAGTTGDVVIDALIRQMLS